MTCGGLVWCSGLTGCQPMNLMRMMIEVTYLILDTSHPFAMAALHTADPGRQLFLS